MEGNNNVVSLLYKTIYDGKGAKEAKDDIKETGNQADSMGKKMSFAFSSVKWAVLGQAIKKATGYIAEVTKKSADYIETLNVLQVAFDGNTESIRKFASSLADTLNLDDSTIIKSAAHFKVLTQSMGIATETGEKLSELLTKMTLDLSSLYNMDFDKAQTALQYAMEGRGTSLKQRTGVSVLETSVQTTLDTIGVDAYVEDMNDAEKAIARVISMEYQLMSSQGDLARTIEAPANQMRVMGEQISMLARNIGNVLLPVVAKILPFLNAILIVLNAIISALARLVGYREDMFDTFEDSNTIDYFDGVSGAIDGVGNSAAAAAKKMQGLRGFDKLNVIKSPTETGGAGGGAGGGGLGINPNLLKAFNDMADQYKMKLEGVRTKATEIAETILNWLGFQKRINEETGKVEWYFAGIQGKATELGEHFQNIGDMLVNIFTNPRVLSASSHWADTVIKNLKTIVGSIGEIGANIAEGLIGSIDFYLTQNGGRISEFIGSMFDISSDNWNLVGQLSESLASISEIFTGDLAKQIGADIIAMFANPFMSLTELVGQWTSDIMGVIIQPIVDNTDLIKQTFEGLLEPIQTVTGTISEALTYIGDTLTKLYDEHAKPFYDSVKEGLSDTFEKFLDVYNKYFQPFIKETADDLKELWDDHLKPLWDKISEFIAAVVDNGKMMWENFLKPLVDWIIKNILPVIVPILRTIKDTVLNVIRIISDVIGGLIGVLTGIINFITGVFSGDWRKAWQGVKQIFKGVVDTFVGIFKAPINFIIDGINSFTRMLNNIKIPDWVPGVGGRGFNIPRIQHLATGGMPEVGQMFIANEKGPELVGQIGGKSFVANQNQMMDLIDKKLQNSGGIKNATFIVQVGNKEIARQVITDLQGMAKDNGKPITIGG